MSTKRMVKKLIAEYNGIISYLYENDYIIEHNPISDRQENKDITRLTWSSRSPYANITFDLEKNVNEVLEELHRHKEFSFLLYDKSVIQVEYLISEDKIIKQRIQYIKKSSNVVSKEKLSELESKLNTVEGNTYFEVESGIPVFIRLDYDPYNHIDVKHSKSHLVFSNIKDCRIPVKKNVTLTEFIKFILREVYNDYSCSLNNLIKHNDEITENELKIFHLNWI